MRTPDEIKKGLRCFAWDDVECCDCIYILPETEDCTSQVAMHALAYIQQLERERDEAVSLLNGECYACLHNEDGEPCRTKEICQCCVYNEDAWGMDLDYNWQWRGVQEGNA